MVKSGEALEKLVSTDKIIFDKTGSLTIGKPKLIELKILNADEKTDEKNILRLAASIAKNSKHPLAQAILESCPENLIELKTLENQGFGLEANFENEILRLGRQEFCEIKNSYENSQNLLSCFFKHGENEAVFLFSDEIKSDAKAVIASLKAMNKKIILLSGDSENAVKSVAKELEIAEFYFEQTPISKAKFLEKIDKFVMIGDGLNDAPALALSPVSISFSRAADISQNIADIIIQGEKLSPIIEVINSSKKSISLMKQNLLIALLYNLIAIPFAVSGQVVPLIAAIAMSSSSLLVLFNSLRCRS